MYILNSNLNEISLNVGLHNSTFGPPMVATELIPHKCQVQYLRLSAPAPLDSVVTLPYSRLRNFDTLDLRTKLTQSRLLTCVLPVLKAVRHPRVVCFHFDFLQSEYCLLTQQNSPNI